MSTIKSSIKQATFLRKSAGRRGRYRQGDDTETVYGDDQPGGNGNHADPGLEHVRHHHGDIVRGRCGHSGMGERFRRESREGRDCRGPFNNRFEPSNTATRAEATVVLDRMLKDNMASYWLT